MQFVFAAQNGPTGPGGPRPGDFVGRSKERNKRCRYSRRAVIERSLVHQGEEAVEDGRTRLVRLIQEYQFGLRRFARGDTPVLVVTKAGDGYRAEYLIRS